METSPVESFIDVLISMPNVGKDEDFERYQADGRR
jgi:hypothetical protein